MVSALGIIIQTLYVADLGFERRLYLRLNVMISGIKCQNNKNMTLFTCAVFSGMFFRTKMFKGGTKNAHKHAGVNADVTHNTHVFTFKCSIGVMAASHAPFIMYLITRRR